MPLTMNPCLKIPPPPLHPISILKLKSNSVYQYVKM
jgi:hypothetical protein